MKPILRRKKYRVLLLIALAGGLYLCFQLFSYKILNLTSRKQAILQQNADHFEESMNIENMEIPSVHNSPKKTDKSDNSDHRPVKDKLIPEVHVKPIRGVHESQAYLYQEKPDGFFQCIESKEMIAYAKVNDDYCDCEDSSDEPGTSACPGSRFYCGYQFEEEEAQFTIGSRVNDGVCDCCDGSDEWGGVTVYAGIHISDVKVRARHAPCNNTCTVHQTDQAADKKIRELGQRLKVAYLREGRKAIGTDLYGPNGVFYQLSQTCFTLETSEYKYSVCPFKSVTQQRFPNAAISLGQKPVWEVKDHGKYILKMENGEQSVCPEGRTRTTLIKFICGLNDRVLQISEEEKCLYVARFATPAAC